MKISRCAAEESYLIADSVSYVYDYVRLRMFVTYLIHILYIKDHISLTNVRMKLI